MKNKFAHYGFVLFLIAAIAAGILAGVNGFTSPIIKANAEKLVNEARKQVLPLAATFKADDAKDADGMKYIPGFNAEDQVVGYVVSVDQNGYAGNINFVLGLDTEGKITGINIISSGETPGLGARINEEAWQKHWIGEDDSHAFNKATDAFAGATISPNAVFTGMMRAIKVYKAEVMN